ncbi:hypothetical protein M422DRAFT_213323 [Sphaerobolus stellatus SS14]|uniref:Peptidase A1 domain-containing protein n=1 Tax=Sphaerobolus stellatus (strain SS14) TaxID=990650 RepID=A0A0C9UJX4_SPHS4|nr:hypothetical protein M422DRAFT_38642 [Sphaerobolus stellatus SS14]KIJ33849.1 hypothetical protein M422DRAFT_213323 [Sphaerobolus stellatus SS14]
MKLFALALLLPYVLALSPPIVKIRNSPISLPLALQINATGAQNLLEADRARARMFLETSNDHAKRSSDDTLVAHVAAPSDALSHTLTVGVGTPPTPFTFLLDTAGGLSWIGGSSKKLNSTSSVSNGFILTSGYVNSRTLSTGVVIQTFVHDSFEIDPATVVTSQGFGSAFSITNFQLPPGVDGIMGLGPVDETRGAISIGPFGSTTIPTITDNLFAQGLIPLNQIGLSFEPPSSAETVQGGEVTFGGVNTDKFTGSINFVPVNATGFSRNCWCFQQSIRYGDSTTILPVSVGQLDTKNVFTLLPPPAFAAYQSATGAVLDNTTGLLRVTADQFATMESLYFDIGGVSYELTPEAQTWPTGLNNLIGGDAESQYLIIASLGGSISFPASNTTFINGYSWISRFYTVLDTAHNQVGFALSS